MTHIALMMEAVSISKTSVNVDEATRRNVAEDCHLLLATVRTCSHLREICRMADCVGLSSEGMIPRKHRGTIRRSHDCYKSKGREGGTYVHVPSADCRKRL
jgi:hypothetical protein